MAAISDYSFEFQHSEESIFAMCRFRERKLFRRRNTISYAAAGACLIVGSFLLTDRRELGICLLFMGCWGISNLSARSKRACRKILDTLAGEFPNILFHFSPTEISIRFPTVVDTLTYEDISDLCEDQKYCYLLLKSDAIYIFDKNAPADCDALKEALTAWSGKKWTSGKSLITWNLEDLLRESIKKRW